MKKLLMIIFLTGFALVGCGIGSNEVNENINDVEDTDKVNGAIIVDVEGEENHLKYELKEKDATSHGKKVMEYTIQNGGEENLTLHFNTSMKYDYYILDENGEEVYRESDEKSYLQAIEKLELEPGEKESYEFELPDLDAGEYVLTVTPAAEKFDEAKAEMKIEIK